MKVSGKQLMEELNEEFLALHRERSVASPVPAHHWTWIEMAKKTALCAIPVVIAGVATSLYYLNSSATAPENSWEQQRILDQEPLHVVFPSDNYSFCPAIARFIMTNTTAPITHIVSIWGAYLTMSVSRENAIDEQLGNANWFGNGNWSGHLIEYLNSKINGTGKVRYKYNEDSCERRDLVEGGSLGRVMSYYTQSSEGKVAELRVTLDNAPNTPFSKGSRFVYMKIDPKSGTCTGQGRIGQQLFNYSAKTTGAGVEETLCEPNKDFTGRRCQTALSRFREGFSLVRKILMRATTKDVIATSRWYAHRNITTY